MFILSKHNFNSIKFKNITILIRENKDLFLNRFISNDLVSVVDLVIKLYIGVRETALCLWRLYWEMVAVTHTVIIRSFIVTSATPIEKFNANYWHFTLLNLIFIYNPSINWLLYFLLLKELLDIRVSLRFNVWNLRCNEMAA